MSTAIELKKRVDLAQSFAPKHSLECEKILNAKGLSQALEYCSDQGIAPPECSLTAISTNADKMRAIAARMLCETKWWKRRLKTQTIQAFENEQRINGKVTNYISDATLAYTKANK